MTDTSNNNNFLKSPMRRTLTKPKSCFDILLESQQKINDFDYKKMISDFELESRKNKILNNIKKKWGERSVRYKEKIDEIRAKNERMFKIREREFKKKLKLKEKTIAKIKELKEKKLAEDKKKKEMLSKRKVDDIQQNIENFNKQMEENRLKVEREVFRKSKYFINNTSFKYS